MGTKIGWVPEVWTPVVGCDKISAGCSQCYAIGMAYRLMHMEQGKEKYAGTVEKTKGGNLNWTGKVVFHEPDLWKPFKKKKPTRFFLTSMGDVFHDSLSFDQIDSIFAVMAMTPHHNYMVLTKRSKNMATYMNRDTLTYRYAKIVKKIEDIIEHHPEYKQAGEEAIARMESMGYIEMPNVWLGVSVENEKEKYRIDDLKRCVVAVKFISFEPLLEDIGDVNLEGISLSIIGGESGREATPCHPDWVRSLISVSRRDGAKVFFKQWGEWLPWEPDAQPPFWNSQKGRTMDGHQIPDLSEPHNKWRDGLEYVANDYGYCIFERVGKDAAGNLIDGEIIEEMPD